MLAHLRLVVAVANNGAIGNAGGLPWKSLKADMAQFRKTTTAAPGGTQNVVIMGRKTWESIPPRFRPLRDRVNVVLSSTPGDHEAENPGAVWASSFAAAAALAQERVQAGASEHVFVIGGAAIYSAALSHALEHPHAFTYTVHLTRVYADLPHDTVFALPDQVRHAAVARSAVIDDAGTPIRFFDVVPVDAGGVRSTSVDDLLPAPTLPAPPAEAHSVPTREGGPRFRIRPLPAGPDAHEEYQYLSLARDVLLTGARKGDRTGTGTFSKFGATMRFSLRDGTLPLLTTKRVFFRGVAEELLWFIAGSTDANALAAKGVHIWDGNGSLDFLRKRGFPDRAQGDLGPVYGFQWRHFGAPYRDARSDYSGEGVDQLAQVIETIRTNPDDRRIVLSAWNPAALPEMALPPCHMFAQFYVANGELSCQMYQRSADIGLGVPFNIASYALLTHMIAHVCGLKTGDFVHVIGDAHVYSNHVDAVQEQLTRDPFPFPKLRFAADRTSIDDFRFEDFIVDGYRHHKSIKMKMAV